MNINMFNNRILIDTFFQKGVPNIEDNWGNICITGPQGSGKNYLATLISYMYFDNSRKIKTNIKSLSIPGKKIEYFTKIEEIINDFEEEVDYIIDEVSKKYSKNSLTDKAFYAWLQQRRKRKSRCILITQEWKEVPMWLRRPIRFVFYTRRLPFNLFLTTCGDALNTTFNTDTLEWETPLLYRIIYKRTKKIADMYDTFEPIESL